MDPILVIKTSLACDQATAFDLFTINTHLESWLTAKANVSAEVGGAYELFWQPETPEDNSTIGCKILALDKPNYLCFEWKGPVQFRSFMNTRQPLTNVVVTFHGNQERTMATLIHTGWGISQEWTEARNYFDKAWTGAFHQLVEHASRI